MVSLTTLPAEDAVRWYESALNGAVSLPGDSGAVRARVGPLSPEPRLGTFVVATTPTVALSLGSQPRMHRMVPREGMPNPVPRLVGTPDEETTLRVWVRETCFVDLATMPDCLGALVLLAPNPLLRGVVDWPVRRTESGGEVIAVRLLPRAGRSLASLRVRLSEYRPDGLASVIDVRIDDLGEGEAILPQQAWQPGLEVSCAERGLLCARPPAHYLRSIGFTMVPVRRELHVEVPGRGGKRAGSRHTVPIAQPALMSESSIGAPADDQVAARLAVLLESRPPWTEADEVLFRERAPAIDFVRGLVRHASRLVLFVDPYFGVADIREFALSSWLPSCALGVLTGAGPAGSAPVPHLGGGPSGDLMAADVDAINCIRSKGGQQRVDVRVMEATQFHDRFLLLDGQVWHFGDSFGTLGAGRLSLATRLKHPGSVVALLEQAFGRAATLATFRRREGGAG